MPTKADIRKDMLAKRRAMPQELRAAACGYVCDKLRTVTGAESLAIAGYVAIQGEVDIFPVLGYYAARKNLVCLPVVSQPESMLQFLEWQPGDVLAQGAHGILEPQGRETIVPGVLLVPLVAFDRRGYRLGYGGGYYDRAIAQLRVANPALQTIGIGYGFQEVEEIPAEPHDMRLDMIVTEKEIIA